MNFGEKITLLRNLKGLSKRQVGDAIGTSDVSIHRYENGVRPKRPEVYEKLARLFGCTVEELTDDSVDLLPKDLQEKDEKKAPAEKPKKTEKANKADSVIEKAVEETTEKVAPEKEEKVAPSIPSTEPFGKRLSTLRKAKNLTLAQAADKVGISKEAYKGMEYRNYRPKDIKVYNKLAKVLGCDVGYLKEGDKRFEKKEPVEKKPEKKVIIIPPKKKTEKKSEVPTKATEKKPEVPTKATEKKSEVPAEAPVVKKAVVPTKAPQPVDLGEIEENIPVEAPAIQAEKSSASSEVIKLVSRLSVLLSGDEIGKDEKDAVMVALNGAYWR